MTTSLSLMIVVGLVEMSEVLAKQKPGSYAEATFAILTIIVYYVAIVVMIVFPYLFHDQRLNKPPDASKFLGGSDRMWAISAYFASSAVSITALILALIVLTRVNTDAINTIDMESVKLADFASVLFENISFKPLTLSVLLCAALLTVNKMKQENTDNNIEHSGSVASEDKSIDQTKSLMASMTSPTTDKDTKTT